MKGLCGFAECCAGIRHSPTMRSRFWHGCSDMARSPTMGVRQRSREQSAAPRGRSGRVACSKTTEAASQKTVIWAVTLKAKSAAGRVDFSDCAVLPSMASRFALGEAEYFYRGNRDGIRGAIVRRRR